jgi:hypothetical protein
MLRLFKEARVINIREVRIREFNFITQLGKVQVLHQLQPGTNRLHKPLHQDPSSINEIEICQLAAIRILELKAKHSIDIRKHVSAYPQKQRNTLTN